MGKTTNIDDIASLSDDELRRKLNTVQRLIDTSRRKRDNSSSLEVDYCYLARESEVRDRRRAAHAAYLEKTGRGYQRRNDHRRRTVR
jgi:hypothetical protein